MRNSAKILDRISRLRVDGDWVLWGERFDPDDASVTDGTPWADELLRWILDGNDEL